MQAEYFSFGKEAFEFIIYKKGDECALNEVRKTMETNLQTELREHHLCYNSGKTETIQPRPEGKYPSEPGCYVVTCEKDNNAVYVGQSCGNRGLARKRSVIFEKLQKGIFPNRAFQDAFKKYGKDAFEFVVACSGEIYNDKTIRLAEESSLIRDFIEAEGFKLYNIHQDGLQTALSSVLSCCKRVHSWATI